MPEPQLEAAWPKLHRCVGQDTGLAQSASLSVFASRTVSYPSGKSEDTSVITGRSKARPWPPPSLHMRASLSSPRMCEFVSLYIYEFSPCVCGFSWYVRVSTGPSYPPLLGYQKKNKEKQVRFCRLLKKLSNI